MSDSASMVISSLKGVYPRELIKKNYKGNSPDFSGSSKDFPLPLAYLFAFAGDSDNVMAVATFFAKAKFHSLPLDILSYCVSTYSLKEGVSTLISESELCFDLLEVLSKACKGVAIEKKEKGVLRPDAFYNGISEVYGESFASPCLRGVLFHHTISFIVKHFNLSENDLNELKDSCYILCVFSVIAGVNSISEVNKSLSNMWTIQPSGVIK